MNSPDVYKEKWFHGKISRDEVYLFLLFEDNYRIKFLLGRTFITS